jgi:uncharacterized membrane protein YeiB
MVSGEFQILNAVRTIAMRMNDVVDGSLEVVVEGYEGFESYFGAPISICGYVPCMAGSVRTRWRSARHETVHGAMLLALGRL